MNPIEEARKELRIPFIKKEPFDKQEYYFISAQGITKGWYNSKKWFHTNNFKKENVFSNRLEAERIYNFIK